MATFVLIPGAGGQAWQFHRLIPRLAALGHRAAAMDYPQEPGAGLARHVDAAVEALEAAGGRDDGPLVVVALSLGGFIGPQVGARLDADLLVLLNAMVPRPGEPASAWWAAVGHDEARVEAAARAGRAPDAPFDLREEFFHDVPADVVATAFEGPPPPEPTEAMFTEPWPLSSWPAVPTRFLQGSDDRFFPPAFQRRVVADRLGPEVAFEEIPGGHLVALSQPAVLADRLDAYQREIAADQAAGDRVGRAFG
jgi:pimeloyl-ACP methyl ester carboxylesterase